MNSMSGHIPLDIENLMKLDYMDHNHNNLLGSLPGNMSRFLYLDVSSNQLYGNFSFQNPCNLQYLNISMNYMTGALTGSLYVCNALRYLDLTNNNFVCESCVIR